MKPAMTKEERELVMQTRANKHDLFIVQAIQKAGPNKGRTRIVGCWKTFKEAQTQHAAAEKWIEEVYDRYNYQGNPYDPQFEGPCRYLILMRKWGVN